MKNWKTRHRKWAVAFGVFVAVGATAQVIEWLPGGDLVVGKPKVEAPAPKAAPKFGPNPLPKTVPAQWSDENYEEYRRFWDEEDRREALLNGLQERLENEMLDEYYPGWRD